MYTMYISATAWGWTECELFSKLAEYLTATGRPTRLERAERFPLRRPFWQPRRDRIDDSHAFLREDATGTFSMMACDDWPNETNPTLWAAARDPQCRVILKQQYLEEAFSGAGVLGRKVRPWIYTAARPSLLAELLPSLRSAARVRSGLFFRGAVGHESRAAILAGLRRRGLLSGDVAPLGFDAYCQEISVHRLILSLPGWGNLCHREIEAFGIGAPVLMPRLRNRLHNDLVPDHHYISVPVGRSADADQVAAAIARRYHEVVDDTDLLSRVARNAMDWYDDNAAFPNSLRLTAELLGVPA